MNRIMWTIFIGLAVALALVIQPLIIDRVVAQDKNKTSLQNATSPQYTNNTRAIVNLKNHTITLIDTTTNETISIKNFTLKAGNTTTNESIGTQNFSGITGNTTTNHTLTEKFKALGK